MYGLASPALGSFGDTTISTFLLVFQNSKENKFLMARVVLVDYIY